jgi:hypothetical protein
MLLAFGAAIAGILLDNRLITGAPAWLKPAKFAISTAIFCGTMAWLFRYTRILPRFIRALGWMLSTILVLEVAIIGVQAARGTSSHFNVSTPLDGALYSVMGASIAILWLATIAVLVVLYRQKFSDPVWGWWLRMAMLITVLGSASGGLMVSPTRDQRATLKIGQKVTTVGAHTVGAPDGGPGLTGVGWSREHGDLRIPHFLGLHGLQILPFLGWLSSRRRIGGTQRARIRMAFAVGASYAAFIAILTWQALRGQSIIHPDALTLWVLAIWLAATTTVLVASGTGNWRTRFDGVEGIAS